MAYRGQASGQSGESLGIFKGRVSIVPVSLFRTVVGHRRPRGSIGSTFGETDGEDMIW